MRKTMLAGVVLVLAAAAARAEAPGGVGVGVVAGDPTGGTARVFLSRDQSLDFGVGFSEDTAFWVDYVFHAWDLFPAVEKGRLSAWVGAGPRIETASDAEFGVRTILGASYWLPDHPVELFATAGPVFRMTPRGGVDADGGIGLRFYFAGASR
ncbi:MAG: hypothetical protein HYZ75_15600 [Elusimicrobia bacterium]|nr:hypothetical protein [Elusimicrobiota bacterium]